METLVDSEFNFSCVFPEFSKLYAPAKSNYNNNNKITKQKLSKHSQKSGCTLLLVKNKYAKHVEQVKEDYDHIVTSDKEVLDVDKL